jgi:hypothetical protein
MNEALVSPKRRFLQAPHGVTSQKSPFFIDYPVATDPILKIPRFVVSVCMLQGHVVAQPVIHRFPTAGTRVRARVKPCGICGGHRGGTGAGFLRVLRFLPTSPQSSPSVLLGWYNRPINDRSDSRLGSTPVPQINKRKRCCNGVSSAFEA